MHLWLPTNKATAGRKSSRFRPAYLLLSRSEIRKGPGLPRKSREKRGRIAQSINHSRHVRYLGVPGFDHTHTRALVSVVKMCGNHCGSGGIFEVEKSGNTWRRAESTISRVNAAGCTSSGVKPSPESPAASFRDGFESSSSLQRSAWTSPPPANLQCLCGIRQGRWNKEWRVSIRFPTGIQCRVPVDRNALKSDMQGRPFRLLPYTATVKLSSLRVTA